MFEFKKLNVFDKAISINGQIGQLLESGIIEEWHAKQLREAAYQMILDIARASGRVTFNTRDKYFEDARSSTHECAAILSYLNETGKLDEEQYKAFTSPLEELSIKLYRLIKSSPEKNAQKTEAAAAV